MIPPALPAEEQIFAGVAYGGAVAALTHPAYRDVIVLKHRYGGFEGDEAEVALLKGALNLVRGHVLFEGTLDERSRSTV